MNVKLLRVAWFLTEILKSKRCIATSLVHNKCTMNVKLLRVAWFVPCFDRILQGFFNTVSLGYSFLFFVFLYLSKLLWFLFLFLIIYFQIV